jgi:adenylate kinase
VNELVADRMAQPDCAGGLILDGYPRTVAQAEVLDGWLAGRGQKLDHVLELVVDGDALIERRAGRLYAPISHKVYHERFNPPKVPGKCDITGESLVHRDDDSPDVVRHRLAIYKKNTQPMLDHYAKGGRLKRIDGMKSIDEVYNDILKVIGRS